MTLKSFHFRPVLTVFTAISLVILIALGAWQLHRLEWKNALIASVNSKMAAEPIVLDAAVARLLGGEPMEYQPVETTGSFQPGAPQKLFGTFNAKAGTYYFAPFTMSDGTVIYVNRGFVPQSVAAENIADAPAGEIELTGLLRLAEVPAPPASWFQPAGQSPDGLWFVRDPKAMAQAANIEGALSVYIDQFRTADDWPEGGTTRTDFRNRHREYALTWFGLAGALIAVWFVFSLQPRH